MHTRHDRSRARAVRVAARLADISARLGLARLAARLPGRLGWAASLAAPAEGARFTGVDREGADVAVFAGCIMREAFGDTERATVRLLERDGHVVTVPEEQTCCGALHAHAGDGERSRELARYNIDAFAGSADAKVVVNAAGCGAHLKDYGHVLATITVADRAKAFAARVRDVSEVVNPFHRARAARSASSIRTRVTWPTGSASGLSRARSCAPSRA